METPKTPASPESQFEKWAKLPAWDLDLRKDSGGSYLDERTAWAWYGWVEAWLVAKCAKYER